MVPYHMYSYAPLGGRPNPGAYSVRLLHLLPSFDTASPLQCHLVEAEIPDYLADPTSQTHQPHRLRREEYHALSYTWGDPVFPETLEVLKREETRGHEQEASSVADSRGIINITQSLHSALQNLRRHDETLVLWADAVCINQADVLERNSQVRNMPQTYTEASSVIVWLGNDSPGEDGRLCFRFFRELADLVAAVRIQRDSVSENEYNSEDDSEYWDNWDHASWRRRLEVNQTVSGFLDRTHAIPIISFLERPWFRRRWIVQEVVLAKEVILHCGTSSIPWKMFELAINELLENDPGVFKEEHRITMRTMMRMRHADAGAKRQLPLDTLTEFSSFLCANPRDRLYALYGVIQHWFTGVKDRKPHPIGEVDYTLSTEEVYTNFAILMIQQGMNFRLPNLKTTYRPVTHVLQLAAAFQDHPPLSQAGSLGANLSIPSWVVDWTRTLSFEPLKHSPPRRSTSFGIPARPVEIIPLNGGSNKRLLVTIGLAFDLVTAAIPLDTAPLLLTSAVHHAKKALNRFLSLVTQSIAETNFPCGRNNNRYEPTNQHIVHAIAKTLVADWEHVPANSYFAHQESSPTTEFLWDLESMGYFLPEALQKYPAYVELVAITMRGRALFLTKKGYIGIAAADVGVGDTLCLLSGSQVPFILRPQNGKAVIGETGPVVSIPGCFDYHDGAADCDENYRAAISQLRDSSLSYNMFRLIGDAYVCGLMRGEGVSRCRPGPLKLLPIA